MANIIEVGQEVSWRGCWGTESPKKTTITSIELCEKPNEKKGIVMKKVFLSDKDRCVFTLSSGKWAYGHQIETVLKA